MKILMVTMGLDIGGAETHIVELSRALSGMGHEITVASAGGIYVKELEVCGVHHVTLPLNTKKPGAIIESYRGLSALIGDGGFDIVHGHARIPNFILSRIRRKIPFRHVTTAHLDFKVNPIYRLITDWGERTLAVSEDIRDYLGREYGIPAERVDITINGIDMKKFSPDIDYSEVQTELGLDPSHRKLVYISRIDHDRSAPAFHLCSVTPRLVRDYPDIDVVIVGAGDDFERLTEAAVETNRIAGRRALVLAGGRADINRFTAMADIFVAVSRSALEAMSAGVPTVISGNQGYLGIFSPDKTEVARSTNFCCRGCPEATPEALESDLRTLLELSEDELREIGDYGRSVVREHYSAAKMAQDYLDCYARLDPPVG